MTEYRVGDKIRVTDTREEGVIRLVEGDRLRFIDGSSVSLTTGCGGTWTRTIEVIERAPDPWQAGDIALSTTAANHVIRQADGAWVNQYGNQTELTDDLLARYGWTAVVRGGKRVTP